LALLIVSAASGCDNVDWGGAEIRLQGPPPALVGAPPDTAPAEPERVVEEVPIGPVLYMAERDDDGISMIPVGPILVDSLGSFPSETDQPGYRARFVRELVPLGSEFVLFSEGVRVGNMTVESVATDDTFCVARPRARGVVELIPEAADQRRFLALPRAYAQDVKRRPFRVAEMDQPQREATLSLPAGVLAQLGAEQPSNLLNTRFDMHAFRPAGEDPPLFAVTHLVRDRLQIERPPPSASSLFLIGVPSGSGYRAGFVWHREVARQGKGAPFFFEQMDWDKDGQAEVLLEVLGERTRWLAAVDQKAGQWTLVHEDPCGAAAPPVSATG
jgi:hypothetical protein